MLENLFLGSNFLDTIEDALKRPRIQGKMVAEVPSSHILPIAPPPKASMAANLDGEKVAYEGLEPHLTARSTFLLFESSSLLPSTCNAESGMCSPVSFFFNPY